MQGRSQRESREHASLPHSSIELSFLRKKLALLRQNNTVLLTGSVFVGLKYAKNALAAGTPPGPRCGSS